MVGRDDNMVHNGIEVNDTLISVRSILHTLFHVLGRYHEHQRPDRDKYVMINWKSVKEG